MSPALNVLITIAVMIPIVALLGVTVWIAFQVIFRGWRIVRPVMPVALPDPEPPPARTQPRRANRARRRR